MVCPFVCFAFFGLVPAARLASVIWAICMSGVRLAAMAAPVTYAVTNLLMSAEKEEHHDYGTGFSLCPIA